MVGLGRIMIATALWGLSLSPLAEAAGRCERLVATGSPDNPPYLWQDPRHPGRLIGADVDLLKQMAHDIGVTVQVLSAGTREQAAEEARSGRLDLLLDLPLDAARLASFDYLHPALHIDDYQVWTRHDAAIAYESLEQLQPLHGSLVDSVRQPDAVQRLAEAGLDLEHAQTPAEAFQRLALGRLDYVIAQRFVGMATVQRLGLSTEVIASGVPVQRVERYLAISHNSACNDAWLRGELSRRLLDGAFEPARQQALQRNLQRWQAQPEAAVRAHEVVE